MATIWSLVIWMLKHAVAATWIVELESEINCVECGLCTCQTVHYLNTHKTWLKSPNVFLLNVMPWVGEVLWSLRFPIGFSCPGNSVPCCLVVSGGAISELREEWLLTIEMTPCLTPFLTSWMTPWMTIFNIADKNCNIMTVSNSCNLLMKQLSSIWFLKSLKRLRRATFCFWRRWSLTHLIRDADSVPWGRWGRPPEMLVSDAPDPSHSVCEKRLSRNWKPTQPRGTMHIPAHLIFVNFYATAFWSLEILNSK